MTTIHDTIYPRLKTIVSPQDLERVYTPTNVRWRPKWLRMMWPIWAF
jgi:hypothetical protein